MNYRFRRRSKQNVMDPVITNEKITENKLAKTGQISQIIGNASQVLMLVLVALGYWFTVRPVYQYQQLQEEFSELQTETREIELRQKELISTNLELQAQQQELRRRNLEGAWSRFVFSLMENTKFYDGTNSWVRDPSSWSKQNENNMGGKTELDPYWQLLDHIFELRTESGNLTTDHPFFLEAESFIRSKREYLQGCPRFDARDLVDDYRSEIAKLPADSDHREIDAAYRMKVSNAVWRCEDNREEIAYKLFQLDLDFSDSKFQRVNIQERF